ncbi:hypothetical protein F896_02880 [Acinetobacter genomosp. 15BJ]|uniref:Uncharacterized protein n=2 Tax=Acinetobacter genomosp. 15BJ TaxID=106651 RepID=R9AWM8_9GAMM|nr:hypothetical protein F896_02880 [Acinetobacter genomosp. 15BJ]
MTLDWMLQSKEISTTMNTATWIPLKASKFDESGDIEAAGYRSDFFSCGSIAFFSGKRAVADQLTWREVGGSHDFLSSKDKDGHYSCIENFEINGNEVAGVHLVFDYPQPVLGGRKWILNPDLIVALGLIKDGNNWVRPEENFVVVAREILDKNGDHLLIEIKREFLLDYLAARKLSLRLYCCYQRAESVISLKDSPYKNQVSRVEQQNGGEFDLLIRTLDEVFNRGIELHQDDLENIDKNADNVENVKRVYEGVRIESVFRRDEWIEHENKSTRVRGDQ